MHNIGFIGLGVMGGPMAGHLSKAGFNLKVFNRTKIKSEQWVKKYDGSLVSSPLEIAKNSDIIISCVGNDEDLKEIIYSNNGVISALKKGAIYVDHTTASATIAKQISLDLDKKGCFFIDAPVSGGEIGAQKGILSIMCGGKNQTYEKVLPIISKYGSKISLIGDVGSGQLAKMVNQICIAGLVQGLSEGINFGINSKIDMVKVLDVIQNGAAGSWQMSNRGETMLNNKFDFGFAVNWMRKDLSLCLEEAKKNKSRLPVTSLIDQFYAHVQNIGGGNLDTSSLIKLLREK